MRRRKDRHENRSRRTFACARATRSISRNGRRRSIRSTNPRSNTRAFWRSMSPSSARCSDLHYASNRHAILLILQATDAAGKDGAIRHVMSGVNPQGCRVYSFKQPSEAELEHDFLWRTTRDLPERGRIAIFNRSYYEEVLVVRVHRDILERKPSLTRRITTGRSGASAIARSTILKGTSTSTEPASSKSFSTFRRRSNASVFSSASTIPRRTGNSATRIEGARILGRLRQGLRGMPQRDEHRRRALVRRSRRRQGKRPADRLPDPPRHVRGARR